MYFYFRYWKLDFYYNTTTLTNNEIIFTAVAAQKSIVCMYVCMYVCNIDYYGDVGRVSSTKEGEDTQ